MGAPTQKGDRGQSGLMFCCYELVLRNRALIDGFDNVPLQVLRF